MSSRIPHKVQTTVDSLYMFSATVGVSGTATSLSCSLMDSTELHCRVSGTSPGRVFITIPKDYSYPQLVAWGADLIGGSTSSLDFGGRNELTKEHYIIEKRAFQYPNGSQLVTNSTGLYSNPNTSTNVNAAAYGGGSVFSIDIKKLVQVSGTIAGVAPVSATLADPIDASVANGSPTANVSVWAMFRNRSRIV